MNKLLFTSLVILVLSACNSHTGTSSSNQTTAADVQVPTFNADSAYQYVARQVAFGPRIPNTAAQKNCEQWLVKKMKSFTDTVYVQFTTVTGWDHIELPCYNIIGSINPQAKNRILLLAHWDTRPYSDEDPKYKTKPFDGADDGGSGVAVLLELAREMKKLKPEIGVDLLLVDVEDYGNPNVEKSFCLGTQYWATHPHIPHYTANYGICLDMVGGKGAQFLQEGNSAQYAGAQMKMIWDLANRLGYSDYFKYTSGGTIEDDHLYVNQLIKIPTVDIIALDPTTQTGFPPFWHTQNDNMKIISKHTLKAVGQTLLQLIYTNPSY
ncbi:MAG: M28 family peptidase [Chitinophagaceae bacterium]